MMANEKPISLKTKEYRKVVKPLLERRRRARINGCLNELRNFILEATKQENSQASKLEKADILEMTVHYLKLLLRQQCSSRTNVMELGRFKAGYTECANEVSACVSLMSNVNPQVRGRLLTHLSKCLNQMGSMNLNVVHEQLPPPPAQLLPTSAHLSPISPPSAHLSPISPPSAHLSPLTSASSSSNAVTNYHFAATDSVWPASLSEAHGVLSTRADVTYWPVPNVPVSPLVPTSASSHVWRPW